MSQTLAQRRAADALKNIEELRSKGKDSYGNYKSYVKALPANILMSGLGQAVATVRSRDRKGYPQLYKHLEGWLCGPDEDAPYRNYSAGLLRAITDKDQDHYIRAQAEAMAYLEWLRKFADAFLEGGEEQD
jgi:CRISPR-associated protein Cmr5